MSIKLTDTQLVLLSAASQRNDQYLTPPAGARLGPARKAAAKLLKEGLVKEVRARKDTPVWRRDEEADQAFALKLTAVGLKAIAVDQAGGAEGPTIPARGGDSIEPEGVPDGVNSSSADSGADGGAETFSPRVPRAGTKISDVLEMLEREAGATIDEIVAATGWLPHTTRAALTGLRKRGYELSLDRSDRARGAVYRTERGEAGREASSAPDAAMGVDRDHRRGSDDGEADPAAGSASDDPRAEAARPKTKVRRSSARTGRAA